METPTVAKRRAKAATEVVEYPGHEHFGSPLNICRVCGEEYKYTPKLEWPFPKVTS